MHWRQMHSQGGAQQAQQAHRVQLLLEDEGDLVAAQVGAGDGVGVFEVVGAQRNLHARDEVVHPQCTWEMLRHLRAHHPPIPSG